MNGGSEGWKARVRPWSALASKIVFGGLSGPTLERADGSICRLLEPIKYLSRYLPRYVLGHMYLGYQNEASTWGLWELDFEE